MKARTPTPLFDQALTRAPSNPHPNPSPRGRGANGGAALPFSLGEKVARRAG